MSEACKSCKKACGTSREDADRASEGMGQVVDSHGELLGILEQRSDIIWCRYR